MHKLLTSIWVTIFVLTVSQAYAIEGGQARMGGEISWFEYEEPSFMEEEGIFYGFFGGYTYRPHENNKIATLADVFSNGNSINMFDVDVLFKWAEVDYTSVSTGSLDNIDDFLLEIRGVAGYDIPVGADSRITPFVGFGYRYLNDDSGGLRTTTGHFGYERESNYFYIPIGVEVGTELDNDWAVAASVEYDFFVHGKQESHLEDALLGLSTVKNDQNDGYGIRGSTRITKKLEKVNLFIEPYIRYWKVEDSDVAPITFSGVLVGFGQEPENKSVETGARVGFNF